MGDMRSAQELRTVGKVLPLHLLRKSHLLSAHLISLKLMFEGRGLEGTRTRRGSWHGPPPRGERWRD